ncbi:hypothetical protein CYMTET_4761 [Cymbomonas tetramitiformis]|uniref:NLRC3 n=1 Tax=Cymbomonas tetramitiformis TaxID=36881 RepID=A0AAE0H0R3_9CHLO|nr:hypothetical protein CYMTET_4761 [Cymbomonas tetramitiformis]
MPLISGARLQTLRGSRTGDEGAKALAMALTPNREGLLKGSLNTLNLGNNGIGPEGAKALAVALTPNALGVFNTSLNTLNLFGNRIGREGAKALADALTPNAEGVFNTSLNTVNLAGNTIGDEGATALAVALTPNEAGVFNTSLNTLNLEHNEIGEEGVKALAVALTPNEERVFNGSLNALNLRHNLIGDEGAKALAVALTPNAKGKFNGSLNTLDLQENNIGTEGAKALAIALTPNAEGVFNTSLNMLDLGANDIGPEGAKAMAVALTPNEQRVFNGSLNTLNLNGNNIGPEGAEALAVALTPNEEGVFNTSVNTLDLALNRIGAEGAKALAVALTPNEKGVFNTSLNTLNLYNNDIGTEGAKALAVALTPNAEGVFNTSLNTLDLEGNQIGPEGAKALAVALTPNAEGVFNTSLNTLNLGYNDIGVEGAKALAVALTPNVEGVFNTSLNTLDMEYNYMGDEGKAAICPGVHEHNTHQATWTARRNKMRQCIRQTHAQARRGSKLSPDLYEAVMTGDWKLARILKNEKDPEMLKKFVDVVVKEMGMEALRQVCAGDLNWKRLLESILPPPPGKVNQHLREGAYHLIASPIVRCSGKMTVGRRTFPHRFGQLLADDRDYCQAVSNLLCAVLSGTTPSIRAREVIMVILLTSSQLRGVLRDGKAISQFMDILVHSENVDMQIRQVYMLDGSDAQMCWTRRRSSYRTTTWSVFKTSSRGAWWQGELSSEALRSFVTLRIDMHIFSVTLQSMEERFTDKVQGCEWTIGNLEMTIDKLERQADPSAVVELVKEQIQGNWGTRLLHKLYFYFMYRILFLVDLGTDALVAASMWQAGGQQQSVWFWITVTFMALPYAILAASVTIYWKSFWHLANPVTWDLKLEEMRIEYKAPFYEVLAFHLRYFLQNLLDWLFKTWHNSSLEVFEALFYDHLLHPDGTLQGPFWASYEQLKKVVEGFLESLPQAIVQIDADGMWFPLRGLAPSMVMRELEFNTLQDHSEFYVKPKGDVKRDA